MERAEEREPGTAAAARHVRGTTAAEPVPSRGGAAGAVLRLQRAVGNAEVQRMLAVGREAPGVIRRDLQYVAQVTDAEEVARFRARVAQSLGEMDQVIGDADSPEAGELREAASLLREMNASGRVTFWHTSGGLVYASYDPGSGEIRVHVNFGNAGFVPSRLIHEAVHALHAARHPAAAAEYARLLRAGGTEDPRAGARMLRYKAWTEYWAYRRQAEYGNLRTEPRFRVDAHRTAMETPDVARSLARLRQLTGESFDPTAWAPPAAPPRRRAGARAR